MKGKGTVQVLTVGNPSLVAVLPESGRGSVSDFFPKVELIGYLMHLSVERTDLEIWLKFWASISEKHIKQ